MSNKSSSGGDAKRKRIGSSIDDDDNLPKKGPRETVRRRRDRDLLKLNVGGTIFTTSKTNLALNSSFFESRFSAEWDADDDEDDDEDGDDIMFVDQDPSTFEVLLKYFRQGFIEASKLTRDVISQLVFFGVEKLVREIKYVSYRHVHAQYGPKEGSHTVTEYDEHYDDDDHIVSKFDELYGSVEDAMKSGFLPKNIRAGKKELAAIVLDIEQEIDFTQRDELDFRLYFKTFEATLDVPRSLIENSTLKKSWELSFREENNPVENGEVLASGRGSFPCTWLLDGIQLFHRCGFTTIERDLCRRNLIGPQKKFWFSRTDYNEAKRKKGSIISDVIDHPDNSECKQFACIIHHWVTDHEDENVDVIYTTRLFSVGGFTSFHRVLNDVRLPSSVLLGEGKKGFILNEAIEKIEEYGYTCREDDIEEMIQLALQPIRHSLSGVIVRSRPLLL